MRHTGAGSCAEPTPPFNSGGASREAASGSLSIQAASIIGADLFKAVKACYRRGFSSGRMPCAAMTLTPAEIYACLRIRLGSI